MPVTYQTIITPAMQRVFFAQEGTYGVAPATHAVGASSGTTSMVFLEPCNAITTALQRQPYENRLYTGVPDDLFGLIETTHHTTITLTVPFRANGIAAWALQALMGSQQGGAAETWGAGPAFTTPTFIGTALAQTFNPAWTLGAGSYLHQFIPNNLSTASNTFTVWHDQGDAQLASGTRSMFQMSAGTVESMRITFTPNSMVMCEITMQAKFPQWRSAGTPYTGFAPPTGYIKLGSDPTYKSTLMKAYQAPAAHFNVMGSTGVEYSNIINSGEITLTRTVDIRESPISQDPVYFNPGLLSVTGTFDITYDGLGDIRAVNPTIMQDYLEFNQVGTLAAQNEVSFIDDDGQGFDVTFYPIKWNSFTTNPTAQALNATVGFTSFSSLSAAQATVPRISSLYQLQLANNLGFTMLA